MSKQKKNKKSKKAPKTAQKSKTVPKRNAVRTDFAGILTIMPGILMCAMILLMMILDVLIPAMSEDQYEVFPNIFTVLDYLITICGLVYIAVSVKRKDLRLDSTYVLFMVFAALIILSTCVNGFTAIAIDGIPYRYIGIFNMLSFLIAYMWLSGRSAGESLREKVLLLYLAAADAVGITVLADMYIKSIPAYHEKKELSAVFFNGNHYGYFLLMAVLIGIGWYIYGEEKKKVFGAASAALNAVLLAINHSMGCILAAALVIIVSAVFILIYDKDRKKRIAVLIAAMAVCISAAAIISSDFRKEFVSLSTDIMALMSGSRDSAIGHNRLLLWDLTAGYIKERPLLGFGCEGIAFGLHDATGRSNPHNELLTYAAYYGIPAAVCYLAGVISIFVNYIRNRRQVHITARIACMAACGYFISSFFGVAMFYTVPFFFIFLGMTKEI